MASLEEVEESVHSKRPVCVICLVSFSKYKCPRCDINYCSLNCYRSISHANCSESFYKDCVLNQLSVTRGSVDGRKKMMEILSRMNNNNEEQEEEESLITEINIESDDIWSKLNKKEKSTFIQMYNSGTLAELVVTTPPWWVGPGIQLMDDKEREIPLIYSDIPQLDSLIKVVSTDIPNNIINIIYCYIYVYKYYNNDIHDLPLQVIKTLLEISCVLSDDISYSTVEEAIDHPISLINDRPHLFNSRQYSLSLINDLLLLINGRSLNGHYYVSLCLSDLIDIINKSREILRKERRDKGLRQRLGLLYKKFIFLLSWTSDKHENIKLLIPFIRLLIN